MPPSKQIATAESSQTTMPKKKQTISWASSMVVVHEVEFHKNVHQIWYQRDEFKAIRKENRELSTCFCMNADFRGLEVHMDPRRRSRKLRRREVIRTVVEEQHDHQQELWGPACEFIAELYQELSFLSMKEEQARGVQDQEAAADTYREEQEETNKTAVSMRISFSSTSRAYSHLFRSVMRFKNKRLHQGYATSPSTTNNTW